VALCRSGCLAWWMAKHHVLMSNVRIGAEGDPGSTAVGASARWIVWRQDDNGNRFEVAQKQSRAEAEELAAVMEARGHKQLYWVAQAGG
jgi:hypothetical protein